MVLGGSPAWLRLSCLCVPREALTCVQSDCDGQSQGSLLLPLQCWGDCDVRALLEEPGLVLQVLL